MIFFFNFFFVVVQTSRPLVRQRERKRDLKELVVKRFGEEKVTKKGCDFEAREVPTNI